jgi:peptidyl-prolyl cis-trans isomerase C
MSKHILLTTAALMIGGFALPAFAADSTASTGGDPVVARVDGEEVHRSEVVQAMQALGPQAQQMPPQVLYPQLLQKVIVTKLVAEKGYADKLQNDPEVKARLKQAESELVAEAYVHKTIQPKISEDKIKAKYDELASKYKPQDEIRARHILVKTEDEANDIIKQLKGGADFAKLAEDKSQDKGSAKQGGDLGYFPQGAMVKPFADAAFSMKVGDISDKPVKTDFGYHIIKVEDKRKSSPPPISEVHDQIANQIGQDMTAQLVKDLEAKAKIEKFNLDGTPMKTSDATTVTPATDASSSK